MAAAPDMAWYPIAASSDLPYRHTYQGQLAGRELAVWRADDDHVNVWENRCLHRGLRLSIGINDGRELRCQYHGWRYANRTAGCTYIPAHPADAPARTICNRTYPVIERYGLVWSTLDGTGEPVTIDALEAGTPFPLRGVEVWAPADVVRDRLTTYSFLPSDRLDGAGARMSVDGQDEHSVVLTSERDGSRSAVLLFVQPVAAARSVVRGVLTETPGEIDRIGVLRHHSTELSRLRDAIETEAGEPSEPEPADFQIEDLPAELVGLPEAPAGRQASLRVRIARKWETAEGIAGFELVSIGDQLPTFQPGAHIDVHLPNGLVRQYSLTNGPGELESYTIGVKLEPDSTGGSRCLHETVTEGDVLAISEPRNNFPLRRDAVRTVLIAGGIGLTPLLSMARTLHHAGLAFELHHFVQSESHVAFADVLEGLGDSLTTHTGLTPDQTGASLEGLLADHGDANHLYVCGPGPMLDAARRLAADAGWPDDTIHFEYFSNPIEVDDTSEFDVALARSALTLRVVAGQTVLEVLRSEGVELPSSCEQGACGTCMVAVLEGEPDHQDVYLSDVEKQRGDRMMTCVSRAKSDRLVLDI